MRKIVLLVIISTTLMFGQEKVIRSNSGKLVKSKENVLIVTKSANNDQKYKTQFLIAEVKFTEPSGNNTLDAGEEATILVNLKNIGSKKANNCFLELVKETPNSEIFIKGNQTISAILPNTEVNAVFKVTASNNINTGQVKLLFKVAEKDGFDLDPVKILNIPTRKFQPPILEIVDYGIVDENKDLKITKREEVALTIRIQNKGETIAYGVKGKLTYKENILSDSISGIYDLGDIKSGEYKDIKSNFYSNNRATSIGFDVYVNDKTGKTFDKKTYNIPLEVPQLRPDEIVIPKIETFTKIESAKIEKLDLAIDIPTAKNIDPHSIAIIIGNKNYKYAPKVEFAINDAAMVRNYVKKAFGYTDENIFYIEDANIKDFMSLFGKESNYKGKLYDYVKTNLSSVFIYYSGHGAPGIDTKQGYIVPIDCDPNKVEIDGYALKTLYDNIDKVAKEKNLKHVTIVMDACFSGTSEGGSLLNDVSPIYITVEKQFLKYENSTLITSTSNDQVSSWYRDKEQSLFTYFFLRGIKGEADFDKNGEITAKELYDFTADEVNGVPYWARRLNSRSQNPNFYGKDFELINGNK